MRSLIVTIFVCYWIAATIVIVASDLGPHRQMHRPEAAAALAASMRLEGQGAVQAYEEIGCAGELSLLAHKEEGSSAPRDRFFLANEKGEILCEQQLGADVHGLALSALTAANPVAKNFRDFQVVAQRLRSGSGRLYVLFLKSNYNSRLDAFGFAVGPTTIWISAGVTILLGFVVAAPIRRVRVAARKIANGTLSTRVRLGWMYTVVPGYLGESMLTGLAVDFNHMADRLESLADAQRILFRDISHELRSPLARLSVALELARATGAPSMQAPLDRIEKEAACVNDLVGQLLTLSHMEALQELTKRRELSLADLVACLLPDLEYEAAGRGRSVVANRIEDCIISGDAVMLQRAFENVVRNAIRYSPDGGIIEIGLTRVRREGVAAGVIHVADAGPGVPSDELESILRPFYRADKSRQSSSGGFGVGLAIANRVANLHAGSICIHNRAEGGLLVEMSFPLIEAQQDPLWSCAGHA